MSKCVAANGKREIGSIKVVDIEGNSKLLKPARETTQLVQEEKIKTAVYILGLSAVRLPYFNDLIETLEMVENVSVYSRNIVGPLTPIHRADRRNPSVTIQHCLRRDLG